MISEPFKPVLTARLRLRCLVPEDAGGISSLMTPAVSRWLASWPVPFTPEMASSRIVSMRELAFRGDALPFAVTDKDDGGLMGWVTLERHESGGTSASLSFWLGEKYQGRGYMREVAPAVTAAGFGLLDLDAIEAGAQVGNLGSFAVMKACGMKPIEERTVHASARGREELCLFYEVRRSEIML